MILVVLSELSPHCFLSFPFSPPHIPPTAVLSSDDPSLVANCCRPAAGRACPAPTLFLPLSFSDKIFDTPKKRKPRIHLFSGHFNIKGTILQHQTQAAAHAQFAARGVSLCVS